METKVCNKCGRELPIEQFSINPACKDGHINLCKDCLNEQRRAKNAKNRGLNDENKMLRNKIAMLEASLQKSNEHEESLEKRLQNAGEVKVKTLDKYTPREILAELKSRGYVWEKMYIKQFVDYSKI